MHFFCIVLTGSQVDWSPFFRVNVLDLMLFLGSHSVHGSLTYLHCSVIEVRIFIIFITLAKYFYITKRERIYRLIVYISLQSKIRISCKTMLIMFSLPKNFNNFKLNLIKTKVKKNNFSQLINVCIKVF